MKKFIDKNFLLGNQTAQWLYHSVASSLPIVDYHNHLSMEDLANNRQYENITQLWIANDPYKHRLMRINGIREEYITGKASDKEKFINWAKTVSKTIGNPLFHWSCLELKRVFDVDEMLTEHTAEAIWTHTNALLQKSDFRIMELVKQWNVQVLITSDDLLDDLQYHTWVKEQQSDILVLPSLRSDTIVAVQEAAFSQWLSKLSGQAGYSIKSLEAYQEAVRLKLDDFNVAGCLLSDHALDAGFMFELPARKKADILFRQVLSGEALTKTDTVLLQSYLLVWLGKEYARRGWAMQLHIGAQRNTSTRLRNLAGSSGGYASVGQICNLESLCLFLDTLEKDDLLPNTILYTCNPADNESFSALTGSFTGDGVAGKVQFGPPWWYNDHQDGIIRHLTTLSSYGLLSRFIGMTTDSRSVLSLSRHEYFRRVLCEQLGEWVEKKRIPYDEALLTELVKDVCYNNSLKFLNVNKTHGK